MKSGCKFLAACGFDGVLHVRAMLLDMYGNSFIWETVFSPIPCTEREEIVVRGRDPVGNGKGQHKSYLRQSCLR